LQTSDAGNSDLQGLLELTASQAQTITGCEASGVYLLEGEPPEGILHLVAQAGLTAAELGEAVSLPTASGLAAYVLSSGVTLARNAGDPLPDGAVALPAEAEFTSYACAPLDCGVANRGVVVAVARTERIPPVRLTAALRLVAEHYCAVLRNRLLEADVVLERDRYQRLATSVGDCLWSAYLEPTFQLALMCETSAAMTGYSQAELLARPQLWQEIVHPDDRWIMTRSLARLTAGETDELQVRTRITRQDGEVRWIHTRGRATRDDYGLRLDAISADVTDHVRLEERVRRADRLSAVGMLAGGIAHEYNNLHFAILGTLDLLLMRKDLEDGVRQHVNRVRDAAERASEITNSLVAFARGGTGARSIVDLSDLARGTLSVVRKEFTTTAIEVDMELPVDPVAVMANRAELGQVLINLIINARQAMEDSPVRRLVVSAGLRDAWAYVRITDTGHGIAPENVSRLFDPFFTTKGAAGSWLDERVQSDAYLPGRGMGLSVAQAIVQEHGGNIEVESIPGEGASFTVLLPHYEPETGVATTASSQGARSRGEILVADDEPAVRAVCRELLQHLNYKVMEATGGEEALKLVQAHDFALVLVDLQMPDMDGLELIRRINALPLKKRPAKLVITGRTDHLDPDTCAELGIASTVVKPATIMELTNKVQLALTRGGD
jgi:PAS domain S-box-containing protein